MTSPLESVGIDERTSWGVSGAKIVAQNYYGMTVGLKHLQCLGENFFLFMGSEWNAVVGLKCSFAAFTIKTTLKLAKQDISISVLKYKNIKQKIVASEEKVYAAKLDKVLSDFSLKLNEYNQIASEANTVVQQLKNVGTQSRLISKDARTYSLKMKDTTSDIKQLVNDVTDEINTIEDCNSTLSNFINDIGVYNTVLTSRVSQTEIAPIKFLN